MANLFLLLFFASLVSFVVAMIKPAAFAFLLGPKTSRRWLALVFGSATFFFLLVTGATAGTKPPSPQTIIVNKIRTERKPIAFTTAKEEDPTLPKGESKVKEAGREGSKEVRYRVKYVDGKEKSRKKVSERVIKMPKGAVLLIGTVETETVSEDIPFPTQNVNDPDRYVGQEPVVRQEGANGKREKVFHVGYKAGKEVSRILVSETIVKPPTPKIVAIPTGEEVYITSTGKRYHQDHGHVGGCHNYLSRSKISVSRRQAEARGYTPCQCASCNW